MIGMSYAYNQAQGGGVMEGWRAKRKKIKSTNIKRRYYESRM